MANILPENETVTFEDQTYVKPETSLNEQTAFIENLRANQQQNNAQIQQDTHNLGTDVPSNLGGLVGGEGYFTSRYQTPQTNSLTAELRATAQAQALNQVLQNQQAMWKNRYNDAYRAAQKRARRSGSGGGGGNTTGGNDDNTTITGGVNEHPTEQLTPEKFYGVEGAIRSVDKDGNIIYTDPKTGAQTHVSKEWLDKVYDDNGNITDDGAVILDTMNMLPGGRNG